MLPVNVVGKADFAVVILAVYIGGNGPTHSYIAGPRGDRQEEACRHDHPEYVIQAGTSAAGDAVVGGIELDVSE